VGVAHDELRLRSLRVVRLSNAAPSLRERRRLVEILIDHLVEGLPVILLLQMEERARGLAYPYGGARLE